ncbi:hypothetical protein BU26DRAFT_566092 [Trematosphaeria pertusa]|uniref:Uncharacterized protein n=1 Tax=Trematosphaeria pertusa TaxID=390896 RepID=A0A6A6IC79_9PLEO|nr:uncharacterized protein BU26DRAFT_566092 [Trematosphaeria pertusa]KAF2247093.1 hypothetical protein BU26DRAFT_566092 [Trematosphaeria pertusa]
MCYPNYTAAAAAMRKQEASVATTGPDPSTGKSHVEVLPGVKLTADQIRQIVEDAYTINHVPEPTMTLDDIVDIQLDAVDCPSVASLETGIELDAVDCPSIPLLEADTSSNSETVDDFPNYESISSLDSHSSPVPWRKQVLSEGEDAWIERTSSEEIISYPSQDASGQTTEWNIARTKDLDSLDLTPCFVLDCVFDARHLAQDLLRCGREEAEPDYASYVFKQLLRALLGVEAAKRWSARGMKFHQEMELLGRAAADREKGLRLFEPLRVFLEGWREWFGQAVARTIAGRGVDLSGQSALWPRPEELQRACEQYAQARYEELWMLLRCKGVEKSEYERRVRRARRAVSERCEEAGQAFDVNDILF